MLNAPSEVKLKGALCKMESLKGRDFLKLLDYTAEELDYLINFAGEIKA